MLAVRRRRRVDLGSNAPLAVTCRAELRAEVARKGEACMSDNLPNLQAGRFGLHASRNRNHAAFSYYQRLQRVKDYIEQNYSKEITLNKAAQIAGLEKKYFSTYFRKKTGVRFTDWVAATRVARAKAMMESQNYNITEIGFAVGFQDLRTFERAFKRYTGMTPRDFRKSIRTSFSAKPLGISRYALGA